MAHDVKFQFRNQSSIHSQLVWIVCQKDKERTMVARTVREAASVGTKSACVSK